VGERLVLLGGRKSARRESGIVEQPPEIVARIGEVGPRRRGDMSRIDAAEHDPQITSEHIGHVASSRVRLRRGASPLGGTRVPNTNAIAAWRTHG
jgi:hypothetical protein